MSRPRNQRSADKSKRREARKQAERRRAARAKPAKHAGRAGDGMLDPGLFAELGYDPARPPLAVEWLALDEQDRIARAASYHRVLPERQQPPNFQLHAVIHAIVETQLAEGSPAEAREAMTRLMAEGLDRHTALHAIGSVMSVHLHRIMKDNQPLDGAAYAGELRGLTRDSWLARADD